MSKELEALKFIKNVEVELGNDLNTATKVFELDHEYDKAFDIVEKALERLEKLEFNSLVIDTDYTEVCKDYKKLEREHEFLREHYNELWREYNEEHKILEIIKRELALEVKEDDGLYRLITYQSDNHLLRKDQYDLLKEVLL